MQKVTVNRSEIFLQELNIMYSSSSDEEDFLLLLAVNLAERQKRIVPEMIKKLEEKKVNLDEEPSTTGEKKEEETTDGLRRRASEKHKREPSPQQEADNDMSATATATTKKRRSVAHATIPNIEPTSAGSATTNSAQEKFQKPLVWSGGINAGKRLSPTPTGAPKTSSCGTPVNRRAIAAKERWAKHKKTLLKRQTDEKDKHDKMPPELEAEEPVAATNKESSNDDCQPPTLEKEANTGGEPPHQPRKRGWLKGVPRKGYTPKTKKKLKRKWGIKRRRRRYLAGDKGKDENHTGKNLVTEENETEKWPVPSGSIVRNEQPSASPPHRTATPEASREQEPAARTSRVSTVILEVDLTQSDDDASPPPPPPTSALPPQVRSNPDLHHPSLTVVSNILPTDTTVTSIPLLIQQPAVQQEQHHTKEVKEQESTGRRRQPPESRTKDQCSSTSSAHKGGEPLRTKDVPVTIQSASGVGHRPINGKNDKRSPPPVITLDDDMPEHVKASTVILEVDLTQSDDDASPPPTSALHPQVLMHT